MHNTLNFETEEDHTGTEVHENEDTVCADLPKLDNLRLGKYCLS